MIITIKIETEPHEAITPWTGMTFEHKHSAGGNPRLFAGEVHRGIHDACISAQKAIEPLIDHLPRG